MPFTPIEPIVVEATHLHTSSLIFLHEVGGSGREWRDTLTQMLPIHTKLISPTAPLRTVSKNYSFPVTAWFDTTSFDVSCPEDEKGIKTATAYVHSLIEKEIDDGISPKRIVVAGFEQGAALALYSALTFYRPLAGVVMISGYLPLRKSFPADLTNSRQIPIYHFHGEKDETIKFELGILSYALLKGFMQSVDLKAYPNVVECTTPDILKDVEDRLLQILH